MIWPLPPWHILKMGIAKNGSLSCAIACTSTFLTSYCVTAGRACSLTHRSPSLLMDLTVLSSSTSPNPSSNTLQKPSALSRAMSAVQIIDICLVTGDGHRRDTYLRRLRDGTITAKKRALGSELHRHTAHVATPSATAQQLKSMQHRELLCSSGRPNGCQEVSKRT